MRESPDPASFTSPAAWHHQTPSAEPPPSTDILWPNPPPCHLRRSSFDGPRSLVSLAAPSYLQLSASSPACSLATGPVLRSPHVSRFGYIILTFRSTIHLRHHRIHIPKSRLLTPLDLVASHARCRQDGHGHFPTHFPSPEDEATAPAFCPDRGQWSQGSAILILPAIRVEASPGRRPNFFGYLDGWNHRKWHQWHDRCEGSPESSEEGCAEARGGCWPVTKAAVADHVHGFGPALQQTMRRTLW